MSSHLQKFYDNLRKRHPYIGWVIGGLLIFVDNVGRAQVIKSIWSDLSVFWAYIRLAWPSHLLTWIGIGFVIFGFFSRYWPKRKAVVPAANGPIVGSPSSGLVPITAPYSSDERVILGSNLTRKYFYEQTAGKTGYQIENTTQLYVGKWMRFKGEVLNISSSVGGNLMLVFANSAGEMNVGASFAQKWTDHLSVISAREVVSVLGKIRQIELYWIWLEDCELEK